METDGVTRVFYLRNDPPRDLPTNPGMSQPDCLTRPIISGLCFFKEMQYMLCASSGHVASR